MAMQVSAARARATQRKEEARVLSHASEFRCAGAHRPSARSVHQQRMCKGRNQRSTSRSVSLASEGVPRCNSDNVARRRVVVHWRALQMAILERELQVGTRTINHIARVGKIARQIEVVR